MYKKSVQKSDEITDFMLNNVNLPPCIWIFRVHSHAPSIQSHRGRKWFDQIFSQWESQKNRFTLIYFGKIQFLPPCIWNLPFMSYRLRSCRTASTDSIFLSSEPVCCGAARWPSPPRTAGQCGTPCRVTICRRGWTSAGTTSGSGSAWTVKDQVKTV
jgi:hypothetical protein